MQNRQKRPLAEPMAAGWNSFSKNDFGVLTPLFYAREGALALIQSYSDFHF
jgi:hypothetical protein